MNQSFEHVAEAYKPMIFSIMRKLHITKEYDEYYQLGLIALWEAYQNFQPDKGSFSSFAYKKIYWKIVSNLRKQLRTQSNECLMAEESPYLSASSYKNQYDFYTTLESILHDLTPLQKAWVTGYIYEGKSLKEIAQEQGVSVGAVKQWRIKTLQKLRKNWHIYKEFFITD